MLEPFPWSVLLLQYRKKVAGHGLRLLVNETSHNFIFSVNEVPFLYVISLTALEWTFLLNCV